MRHEGTCTSKKMGGVEVGPVLRFWPLEMLGPAKIWVGHKNSPFSFPVDAFETDLLRTL